MGALGGAPLGDETHVTSQYMRAMSHLTRGGIGHFDPDRFSTSFRGCGPLGSERPVLRTGSITLLRYVSLPVQGRSDRVWARGAEDSDRRVRWATTPPAENMRARARALLPLSRSPERPWTGRVAREYFSRRRERRERCGRSIRAWRASRASLCGGASGSPTVSDREAIMRQS